ncbi:MAG: hypothetical protein JW801_06150 [Bacteroidales bacterium]|nr:hypothetical protein [Bacteroidales bacterium]
MKRNINLILAALAVIFLTTACNTPQYGVKKMTRLHVRQAKLMVEYELARYKLKYPQEDKNREEYAKLMLKENKLRKKAIQYELKKNRIALKVFSKYFEDEKQWEEVAKLFKSTVDLPYDLNPSPDDEEDSFNYEDYY